MDFFKRKSNETVLTVEPSRNETIDEILLPVRNAIDSNDAAFLNQLYTTVRRYLVTALSLEQGLATKEKILKSLQLKGMAHEEIVKLDQLFSTCEAGMFTAVHLDIDKAELLQEAEYILNTIKSITEKV